MVKNLPVLETSRLTLRPLEFLDAKPLNALIDKDERVYRFNPVREKTLQERRRVIRNRIEQYKTFGFGCYAILTRNTGTLIGQSGLSPYWYEHRNGRKTLEFEVMYHLGHAFWGQGFATEAAQKWVEFAFKRANLPRIITCPDRRNKASIAVLERLGFSTKPDWLESDTVICALHHADDGPETLALY